MAEIGTALAATAIKTASTPAANLLSTLGRSRYDRFIANYTKAFQKHLDWSQTRTSTVKNLIYRDSSAQIDKIYVNVRFSSDDQEYLDAQILEGLKYGQRYIISGTGGAGKTVAMKWVTQQLITSLPYHQKIPLFVELRDIEKISEEDFVEILFQKCTAIGNKTTLNQFVEGLKAGLFIPILDAVDEIPHEFRAKFIRRVETFSTSFPETAMIISTRHDPSVEALSSFRVLHTTDMKLDQVKELLDRVRFSDDVKKKLVSELEDGLYEQHKSFLSNPLLVTIMLIAYDQSMEIPTKLSLFYKTAFEGLYQKHDATKVWSRNLYAGLPLDEFERLFSVFCFRSYVNNKYEFGDTELLNLFRDAAEYCSIDADPRLLVKDASECACLIQKEGLDNVFAHRSFQEYFTAVFLSKYHGDNIRELMTRALGFGISENVPSLLYEIDRERLEREYVLPKIDEFIEKIYHLDLSDPKDLRRMALTVSTQIRISEKLSYASIRVNEGSITEFAHILMRLYANLSSISNRIFSENYRPFASLDDLRSLERETSSPTLRKIIAMAEKAAASNDIMTGTVPLQFTPADSKWLVSTQYRDYLEDVRSDLLKAREEILDTHLQEQRKRDLLLKKPE